MNESSERCPHCRQGLEIVGVKFVLRGARTLSRCINCAALYVEAKQSKTVPLRYLGRTARMIEALNSQVRSILFVAFAAVLVAAVLRHTLHVYGGFSPKDIRSDSLLLVSALAIVVVFFRIVRRS
jgi:hypothetical protein